MDINTQIQILRTFEPQIDEIYCIVNKQFMLLDKLQNMDCDEFRMYAQLIMPQKLYRYYHNKQDESTDENGQKVNYCIQSLRDNTVFMASPTTFDDVYDSDINIEYADYERLHLLEYCKRCELSIDDTMSTQELGNALIQAIAESYNSTGNVISIFKRSPISETENLSNKVFAEKLMYGLLKGYDISAIVADIINSSYQEYSQRLQNTFRATCFSTTPYSQLMWGGSYGNNHKRFCVEYTILHNEQYSKLLLNLFPMIYCRVRPDMSARLEKFENSEPTHESVWDIYFHGALRKSIDWAYQDEWRLLSADKEKLASKNYCVPFFPITKVYLGCRMSQSDRKEIIEICNERRIPYVGVVRRPDVFEMQECHIKCEDCPRYQTTYLNN